MIELCISAYFLMVSMSNCSYFENSATSLFIEVSPGTLLKANSATSVIEPEEVEEYQAYSNTRQQTWESLAECESGNWIDGGRAFEAGSARWDWAKPGTELPPWGTTIHHGGLQFLPSTWDWVAPMVGLGHIDYAYNATREEQIQVAEKVLELQGWGAWPVCSRKLNLR